MSARPQSDDPSAHPTGALRSDLKTGMVSRAGGGRVAVVAAEFIQTLHFAMVEEFGDRAPDMLYRAGYEWALQEMLALQRRLQGEFGGRDFDFWQMDPKFVLDSWWQSLAAAGWGRSRFDCSRIARGMAEAELTNGIGAVTLAGSDKPACHLYAGLFAGALSFFERAERHAVEIQCAAAGAESCRFVIGPGADIDAVEAWRRQGSTLADILRRCD